jgi:hypothetical protein
MSNDRSSCESACGELEKKIMESPKTFPCEILDFVEEARREIFAVINDGSLGRKEAWTKLVAVIEKWFGAQREKGTLESIKIMLLEKMRRKQEVEDAVKHSDMATELKRARSPGGRDW